MCLSLKLENLKDIQITVKPDSSPQFCKARSVAFVLKEKLDKELYRLLDSGVLEPVKLISQWASPIVPIVKQDGTIQISGDYKLVNKAPEQDTCPLPRIENLFALLPGGRSFTKLDLSHAYQQLSLDEKRPYKTINTHQGLFQYKPLPFGIFSAPSFFQRMMDILLQGLKKGVYLDDILW